VFLGYTSNLISSGLREVILHLVKHKHVSALVTTAGGIEEDFIKCLGKTYLADFNMDGADLRRRGMNRIGNLIVPNDNYCKFEDWLVPLLDRMLAEQKDTGVVWTPSSFIRRLGKEINDEESVYYWAYKVTASLRPRFPHSTKPANIERHSRVLSRTHRRFAGRHVIFPLVPVTGSHSRYCPRHPQFERTRSYIPKSRDDNSWGRSVQTPGRQCDAYCGHLICLHQPSLLIFGL
jgi:hypothetical protein